MSYSESFPAGGLVELSRAVYDQTPLAVAEIRPDVFVLSGAGGTVTGVGGSHGCAVIDTGYRTRVNEIRSRVRSSLQQEPRWLINTHWHFDHTDGNLAFVEQGATIAAHSNCRKRMSVDQYVQSLEWRVPASPRAAWPTVTIDAPASIDLGTQTLELLTQEPAHTDGDVAVWLPATNVLVLGDLMTNGSYPVIDESSRGSLRGLIEALEGLMPLVNSDTVVVPGHGPIGNQGSLIEFCEMLRTVEGRIQPMVAASRSAAEVLASAPTADFDPVWGRGYVTGDIFVRMILAGIGLR